MDRPIQPLLMVAGCAVLVVAAIALPVAILQPEGHVAPGQVVAFQPLPTAETPVQQAPVAQAPVAQAPIAQAPVAQAPVTQAPVDQAPAVKAPSRRRSAAKAPTAQAPAPEAQKSETPAASETSEGDGLSRGQRFRIVEQEELKKLGLGGTLSSSLAKAFAFPTTRSDAIFGIDVSHHTTDNCDCPIDWDRVGAQKVAFVYAKATEGGRYRDPTFDKHWSELGKRPKIHRGAYHFLRADVSAETQAKHFLDAMGKLEPGDLPPVMDLEWDTYQDSTRKWEPKDGKDHWSNLGTDEILAHALKWLQIVEKETGRVPVVYTSRTWWSDRRISEQKLELLKRYPIWISAMEAEDLRLEKPGVKGKWAGTWSWTLWQFTNMGDLTKAGIKNPKNSTDERTDVSIYPGSLGQFQQAMGLAATIEVVDNKVPTKPPANTGEAVPGGAGTTEPPKEPLKENQAVVEPGADSNTSKLPASNPNAIVVMPGTGGGTIAPDEPQKEPQKEAQKEAQVTDPPVTDGNAVKPAEPNQSNVMVMPGTGGDTVVQVEPPKELPKEAQLTDPPVTDGNTSKPPASNPTDVVVLPGPGGDTVVPPEPQKEPPKEAQLNDAPVTDGNAIKPSEPDKSNVIAMPGTGGDKTVVLVEPPKDAPKDTSVTDAPVTDGNLSKPPASNPTDVVVLPGTGGGTAVPAEPQKEPQKQIVIANAPESDKNSPLNPANGAVPATDTREPNGPSGALSEKPTIEIVLKNGRILRVEQGIDPAVLMQLIALLEK